MMRERWRRFVRWWRMRRGDRPAWVTGVRVRFTPPDRFRTTCRLEWEWWASEEDKAAATARMWRKLCAIYRWRGVRLRMAGPVRDAGGGP